MRIEEFLSEQYRLAESSRRGYEKDLVSFERITESEEPTEESIHAYIAELRRRGRGDSHISRTLYSLKRYCRWSGIDIFGDGKIEIPGFEFRTILPSDVITEADVQKLVEAGSPLEKAVITLLYDTGCRIGELLKLQVDDIDWGTGMVFLIRKGRRRRREPLLMFPETLQFLIEYREWRGGMRQGLLFPFEYIELRKWLVDLAKKVGVEFPRYSLFHNIRHCKGATMRQKNVPLDVIADQLGHSNITTTLAIYSRFTPEQLHERVPPPPWAKKENGQNS